MKSKLDEMAGDKVKLDKYGRKELIGHLAGPVFIAAVFFLSAGRIDMNRAWLWAILNLLYIMPEA